MLRECLGRRLVLRNGERARGTEFPTDIAHDETLEPTESFSRFTGGVPPVRAGVSSRQQRRTLQRGVGLPGQRDSVGIAMDRLAEMAQRDIAGQAVQQDRQTAAIGRTVTLTSSVTSHQQPGKPRRQFTQPGTATRNPHRPCRATSGSNAWFDGVCHYAVWSLPVTSVNAEDFCRSL